MKKRMPFPKPNIAYKYAFMSDPASNRIGFPQNRLGSDHKLQFPFSAEFDDSDPQKLIEQCKDNENCPVAELLKYGGPGSGHFQHAGRPGQVGGSAPSGRGGADTTGSSRTTSTKGRGLPGTPSFVGPPSPFASGGSGGSFDVVETLRNISDNVFDTDLDVSPDFSPDEVDDTEITSAIDIAIDTLSLPLDAVSALESIKEFSLAKIKAFIIPIENFLKGINDFAREGAGMEPREIEEEAKEVVDTFKRKIEQDSHEEVSKNVMRSLISQNRNKFIDPEIVSEIADQILSGELKQRGNDINQAFLGIGVTRKASAKETKATAIKERREKREAATEERREKREAEKVAKAEQKALDKIAKAKAKALKDASTAEKAIARNEDRIARQNATAAAAAFRRAKSAADKAAKAAAKLDADKEEPIIDDIIDDILDDDTDPDDIPDIVEEALNATGGGDEREEAIEKFRAAGIQVTAGGGRGEQAPIPAKGTLPSDREGDVPEDASIKEQCQAMVNEAKENGTIDPDANISEIITELRDDCPFEDITDFINSLLEDSDDRETDIEILIDDGFAIRNDVGEVFITDNDSIEPVKIEDDLIRNTEDIYKLAESCPITQDNGCPLFLSAFAENTSKDLGWKEIFEFDDSSMLDIIISNFHKLKDTLSPPLKLGHDEKQALVQNSGFPSAGWITGLKRKVATNKLLAYFSNVPEQIVQLIESGAYRRISAELYNNYIDPDTKEEFGPTMRAVSILGADVPRIKTLDDLTVIYHSDKLPYKILTEENNMDSIKKLEETVKGMKKDVKDLLKLAGEEGSTLIRGDGTSSLVENLKKRIAELEAQIKAMRASGGSDTGSDSSTNLSEKVKSQDEMITKLSASVITIGSELKDANEHILDSKKTDFKTKAGKILTPAFIDKALESINFAEENNKVLELIQYMTKLQEDNALFLAEPMEIEEELVDPKIMKFSQDKLHNQVTALAEKEKINYTEAFNRVMLLKKA
jgi:hypothetical protein